MLRDDAIILGGLVGIAVQAILGATLPHPQ
jgi:hypothetical protein